MSAGVGTAAQFNKALKKHVKLSRTREKLLYARTVAHVERSIKFGSATTGSPGQPVDKERLRPSYQRDSTLAGRNVAIISTKPYARIIEHNFRGATLRSKVGGWHSLKITRLNFRLIVKFELDIIKGAVK